MIGKLFNYRIFFLLLVLNSPYIVLSQNASEDIYTQFPFLNSGINAIQYKDKKAFEQFYNKWNSSEPGVISIAHFGDSHVQPDAYPGKIRNELQSIKGFGGQGMIFPYKIARTYSSIYYTSGFNGAWQTSNSIYPRPKLPLGPSGFTALTSDSTAGFIINFKQEINPDYRILKLFCRQDQKSYDVRIRTGDFDTVIVVDSVNAFYKFGINRPFIQVNLPVIGNSISLQLLKQNEAEETFEFYGISLESIKEQGVIYHNLGVGGATYSAVYAQKLFNEQLAALNPDLVVLDYGTNDYLYNDLIPFNMESIIVEAINKVRLAAPKAAILLTSTQDMNWKGKHLRSGEKFSELVKKIAFDNGCLFYDWFWVSGGNYTMPLWYAKGLSQKDHVHLYVPGATLKGSLLAEALKSLLDTQAADYMILADEVYELASQKSDLLKPVYSKSSTAKKGKNLPAAKVPPSGKIALHKVKPGETLSHIAEKYHTSVKEIQRLNGLKNTKIGAGKTLKVPAR